MDMLVNSSIGIKDYKQVEEEIGRITKYLQRKGSLVYAVNNAISKKKKLDSDQFFDIIFDVQ